MSKALFFLFAFFSVARADNSPETVVLLTVAEGSLTQHITAVGTFTPYNDVMLKAEIEGSVKEVHFSDGGKVEPRAPLITLHNKEQKAKLEKAKVAAKISKNTVERKKKLLDKKFASHQVYEDAVLLHQNNEAELTLAEENLRKTEIVAPFDGVLSGREVAKGSYVQPGDNLVRLQDITPIRLVFQLPQKEIPVIKVGSPLTATTDVYPGKFFEGQIEAIDPSVNKETRSVTVYATFPNKEQLLIPGLFGHVQFPLLAKTKASPLRIPESALVLRQDGTYVYQYVKGKAVLTKITLGTRTADQVEVLSGLKKGDVIVLEGQDKIKDGDAIAEVKKS